MSRWKVQNIEYAWVKGDPARLERMADDVDQPWQTYAPYPEFHSKTFATHAEAITYADKQARRNP